MINLRILALFVAAQIAVACGKPECSNENALLNNFAPSAKEYKTELAAMIRERDLHDLSFWYDRYASIAGKECIVVDVVGRGLCAEMEIEVNDWSKISDLRREPSGYSGAELEGFKFETVRDSVGVTFVFTDVERVVD